MADRPILFSAPMVRALLEGRKTQTRRVLKPLPAEGRGYVMWPVYGYTRDTVLRRCGESHSPDRASRYAPGDRLWVREAWTAQMDGGWTIADARRRMFREKILYRADGDKSIDGWWPSIHMPREFSRITLIVEAVNVERLQSISEADAIAEGIELAMPDVDSTLWRDYVFGGECDNARLSFETLWISIHGPDLWTANPWVIAITFRVVVANIDNLPPAE